MQDIAEERIVLIAADQHIIMVAAFKRIRAISTFKRIMAITSEKLIGIGIADQAVIAKAAPAADRGAVWREDKKFNLRRQVEIDRRNNAVIAFKICLQYKIIQAVDDVEISPRPPTHDVEARSAGQAVIAHTCLQNVVTCIAMKAV